MGDRRASDRLNGRPHGERPSPGEKAGAKG